MGLVPHLAYTCRFFHKMFEGYAEETGHLAVQEVYPITSEGGLLDTIKKRRTHERTVVGALAVCDSAQFTAQLLNQCTRAPFVMQVK
jgi:hypothetical protein